jgi:ketosteroid isomerase-like protein
MTISHAAAHDLLERLAAARATHAGDDLVAEFSEHAEVQLDPFAPPLLGHLELRAYLEEAARAEDQAEMTVERHWVVADTVLAAWHMSWIRRTSRARARASGFLVAEIGPDDRIARLRQWWNVRETPVG